MDGQERLLRQALQSTCQLRDSVRQTFEDLLKVPIPPSLVSSDHKSGKARESLLKALKSNLTNVNKALGEIETGVSSLEKLDSKTLSLGNSGLLSLDGESSSLAVYSKLLNGLEWSKKVKSNARIVSEALKSNRKREAPKVDGESAKKSTLGDSRNSLQEVLLDLQSSHPETQLQQTATPEGFPVLQVSVGKAFGVSIGLSRLRVEQLVVRSISEQQHPEDIWTASRSSVLQKLSDKAMATALKLQLKHMPVDVLDHLLTWLKDQASNNPVQMVIPK